eukprot:8798628-Alexandrium_andersonii.AAC.1
MNTCMGGYMNTASKHRARTRWWTPRWMCMVNGDVAVAVVVAVAGDGAVVVAVAVRGCAVLSWLLLVMLLLLLRQGVRTCAHAHGDVAVAVAGLAVLLLAVRDEKPGVERHHAPPCTD